MALSDGTSRRRVLRKLAGGALTLTLAGCAEEDGWYGVNVTGTLPDLAFRMTRARDGAAVTEEDFRGRAVALFFGFTYCPDVCPLTLANLSAVADRLGPAADRLSIVFVTVDPERDTPAELARYVAAFTDRATGLRGDPNQLAALARRLRVTYKVSPHEPGADDYAVSHGKSVYIFDPSGDARLMWPEFDTADADIEAAAADLERLIGA
ncbi:SCO family protein [Roseitranquillus sediminis]|uniref:SCO family protein n=1 Tax=Roseitranquillus sediminis TaxID=2809051 RepID=UPI001D0CC92B|nr:SCO family protein [Roseitranquillus sediminis]